LRHPARVEKVRTNADGFAVDGPWGSLHARRIILCTGGQALPKSGSDGAGYSFASALGHSVTPLLVPALVPLRLESGHWLTALSGLALPAELTLSSASGKRMFATTGAVLCTHFGLSGPAVLDVSRHYLVARHHDGGATLSANWIAGSAAQEVDAQLLAAKGRTLLAVLRELALPERMVRALLQVVRIDPASTAQQLSRERRRTLVAALVATPLPIAGDRGYTFAEATAGGVPLAELHLDTMESRRTPGLHVAGELCDVDGRIGGFNFQWAWASGYLAGCAAAKALCQPPLAT
jgi:predicted Rossmann fold flavoprotein